MHGKKLRLLFPVILLWPVLALLLSGCPVPDDDDDATPPDDGNVRVVGGLSYDTIQEAIDAAPVGGSIVVNPGIYEESLSINKALGISGPSREQVLVTGDGDGTIVEIDQVDGLVQITGMTFQAPYEELGTVRGFRVSDSTEVLLHELNVGFGLSSEGDCDHGLVGIEVSQSTVTVSATDIVCIGFTSDNGGSGILAQTNSELTVDETLINGVGSFAIHTIDSSLSITSSEFSGINRPPNAEQFESDGSAIYVEQATTGVTIADTSVSNGSFVGAWIEGPSVSVTNCDFANFAYGVYHPGDAASATGRSTEISGSTFTDLASEAVLTFAAATVSASVFRNVALVPDALNSPDNSGLRVVAPGASVTVSGNTFENLGVRGVGVYGSSSDGNVAEVTVTGNTVTGIVGGNGIDIHYTDSATISENIVDSVDHAYFDDDGGPNAGAIVNGYGIDCFNSTLCTLSNNSSTGSEFANFVIVNSSFTSDGDTAAGGSRAGYHIQSSQGTFNNLTIQDQQGYGVYGFDVTLQGTNNLISGVTRGPNVSDLDGLDDPLPEEISYFVGGTGVYVVSQGAPTYLSWVDSVIENSADSGMTVGSAQLLLSGNRFTNNGYDDEEEGGFNGDSALEIYGVDELSTQGPQVINNIFDGSQGIWGLYLSDVPGIEFTGNTVCVGESTALYARQAGGGTFSGNTFGYSDDETVTFCGGEDWSQSIYLSNSDADNAALPVTLAGNSIEAVQNYGIYISGLGDFTIDDNSISGAASAGIYASSTLPQGLTSDNDGDGQAEYNGDCNDTDPTISSALAEIPGDGVDNDCDGVADDGTSTDDTDGDGVTIADGDCNDNDPGIYPEATEILSNYVDDNCDGWADFDAVMPIPSLTMSGNTISGGDDGLRTYGANVNLLDPAAGEDGNTISDVDSEAVVVATWSWGNTPASGPGSLIAGPGTTLGPSGSDCVRIDGDNATVSLTGTTLQGCGNSGVFLAAEASATLTGAVINDPLNTGLRVSEGTLNVGGGTTINATCPSGLSLTGGTTVLDGLAISGAPSTGINLDNGSLDISTADIAGTTNHGIDMSGGVLSAGAGLGISGSGGDGLHVTGGSVSLNGSNLSNNSGAGLSISGVLDASLTDLVLEDNGGYGLLCDGSGITLGDCSASCSNNASGDFSLVNGCEVWSCTAL
ncbi:MAG: right-handed parallel beta-helix repeat-containing protein [Myxococcota bacterium]|nr:right-handed parallel beta-helix repeat-containing protein [Myxococcota bacterium]